MKMSFHSHVDKTHFHTKGFARGLALKKRHKTIWKWPIGRVPKGFRAPGLRAKNCRAPGLQDSTIGGLWLHGCTLELHLTRIIFFVRAPRTKRLWAPGSTTKILGLQGSKDYPFETLYWVEIHHDFFETCTVIPSHCEMAPR